MGSFSRTTGSVARYGMTRQISVPFCPERDRKLMADRK
jgi:hypothetical protein